MTITSPDSPNWDFSRYQANEVVINLSTNDPGYHAGAPVQYVDTTGWLVRSDFASDDRHPTDAGQVKVANKLGPILAPVLGLTWKNL